MASLTIWYRYVDLYTHIVGDSCCDWEIFAMAYGETTPHVYYLTPSFSTLESHQSLLFRNSKAIYTRYYYRGSWCL